MSEDSEANPIKDAPLWDFVKEEEPDMQVGGDSLQVLKSRMEGVTARAWRLAAENAREEGRKTVNEQDVRDAFGELFYPHMIIDQAITTMAKTQEEFEDLKEQSPVLED